MPMLNDVHKDQLISLWAENDIDKIESTPALTTVIFGGMGNINSIVDIEKNITDYKQFITTVRAIKIGIEDILKQPKTEAQVRFCLIQLLNVVEGGDSVKIEIFNAIVAQLFLKNLWKHMNDLVTKYMEISAIIQTWNHFFVSYTNRDAQSTNDLYKPELFNQFDPEIIKSEISKNNLIAKYLVKCFKKYNSLKVFFDKDSIICGDIVEDEIYGYCEKTFAFIQLIEDITFNQQLAKNWCHLEYEHFKNHNGPGTKTKHFFLTDGYEIKVDAVPNHFQEWAQDILDTNYERINRPFDVTAIKKKCQDFTVRIKASRINYINSLIKAVA